MAMTVTVGRQGGEGEDKQAYKIASMFKFVPVIDPQALQESLRSMTERHRIQGMLFLATEGLNGTVAGFPEDLDSFLKEFLSDERFREGVELKFAHYSAPPFYRMRISIRPEIVTLGVKDFQIEPSDSIHNLEPHEWNALLARKDVVLIDTRNDYEFEVGTFENAINPNTKSFREFPQYMKDHFDQKEYEHVAMFCTGGIRCEKVSSYLVQQGYKNIYNLKGGILKYLETMPEDQSKWKGDCFVFDQRVSVRHGLVPGDLTLCRGCRHPLTAEDRTRQEFQEGVHCHRCVGEMTEAKMSAALQREKQMQLAQDRKQVHLGYKHPGHQPVNRKRKGSAEVNQ